jgi:hypothetical protein
VVRLRSPTQSPHVVMAGHPAPAYFRIVPGTFRGRGELSQQPSLLASPMSQEPLMSSRIQIYLPAVLLKISATAGFISAAILVVNAAKRAGIIPTSPFTQLAAPIAQLAAIVLVIGIYVLISRQAGALGATGAGISVLALAGLVAVEFVLNLVFPYVDPSVVAALRAGPLGIALTAASMLFLLGTVALMLALWRSSSVPKGVVILYTASVIPIALRTVFPETVLQLGLAGLAVAITCIAVWMLRSIPEAVGGTAVREPAARVSNSIGNT